MSSSNSDNELEVTTSTSPDAETVQLIKSTVYGVDGGLRYRHQDTEERVANLITPEFFSIKADDKLLGTSAYCYRDVSCNGNKYEGTYIRYFAVAAGQRSKGIGTQIMNYAFDHFDSLHTEPSVWYAYIEMENIRSMKVSKGKGVMPIGKFRTLFFSRFFPKKQSDVQRAKEEDKALILELLQKQYANHAFVSFQRIFFNNNYFVIKKNNEIVAGVQCNKVSWIFDNVPGFSGWLTMKVIPHLPILGRLSQPKDYKFSSFEGIYCKEGHEADLIRLFEHVLAEHGTYTGMAWMDEKCPVSERIRKHGNMGFLSKVQKSPPASIVADFRNTSQEEIEEFKKRPAYISAFDLT